MELTTKYYSFKRPCMVESKPESSIRVTIFFLMRVKAKEKGLIMKQRSREGRVSHVKRRNSFFMVRNGRKDG